MGTMIDLAPGYYGEKIVWQSFRDNLDDRIIVYNSREVLGKEFDFCLLVPGKGLVIVEVKGWKPGSIQVLGQNRIKLTGMSDEQRSPKAQARDYRFNLVNKLKKDLQINPAVFDLACFPLLTEEDYINSGLSAIIERDGVLLASDLEDKVKLSEIINNVFNQSVNGTEIMDRKMMEQIRTYFEPEFSAHQEENPEPSNDGLYSLLQVIRGSMENDLSNQLMQAYGSGTKLILFFSNLAAMELMKKTIRTWAAVHNLRLDPSKVIFTTENRESEWLSHSSVLKLFNLELFLLAEEDADQIPDLRIENGITDQEQSAYLEKLSTMVPFNLVQYRIEHQPVDSNIMICAGAGTGKTYSMVSRVAFLSHGKNPYLKDLKQDLGMITFTNEAADTMRERLTELFMNYYRITRNYRYLQKIQELMNARITTIHRFCIDLIRANSLDSGMGIQFSISTDQNLRNQIYREHYDAYLNSLPEGRIMDQARSPLENYSVIRILMNLADRVFSKSIPLELITPATIGTGIGETIPDFNDLILQVLVPSEKEYGERLKERDRLELNRIIAAALELIKNGSRLELNGLKVLFVDEFQDTDNSQIDLLNLIISTRSEKLPLFVVGDLKQSIYRFRGATMSAFDRLRNMQQDWTSFSLQMNYRSDRKLLHSLNQIFMKMAAAQRLPYGPEDQLIGVKDLKTGRPVTYVAYEDSEQDEKMKTLMKTIKREMESIEQLSREIPLSNEEKTIAVLVRTNSEAEEVVRVGRRYGIPIQNHYNGGLFQTQAAMDVLKLLEALSESSQPAVLTNLLCSNIFDCPQILTSIAGISEEDRLDLLEYTIDENLKSRMNMTWNGLKESAMTDSVLSVLYHVFSALEPWKNESIIPERQRQYRFEYDQLIEDLRLHWRADSLSLGTARIYLESSIVSGRSINRRNIKKNRQNEYVPVICMTVHKSKGLEFGTVILPFLDRNLKTSKSRSMEVDFNESGFGYFIETSEYNNTVHQRNTVFQNDTEAEESISEEIRILYVALTRAIRKVIWLSDPLKKASSTLSDYLKEPEND